MVVRLFLIEYNLLFPVTSRTTIHWFMTFMPYNNNNDNNNFIYIALKSNNCPKRLCYKCYYTTT